MKLTDYTLKYIGALESSLEAGLIEPDTGYLCRLGKLPVMLSASHSVAQYSDGELKPAEARVAVLCEWLYRLTGCSIIYKTVNRNDGKSRDSLDYYKESLKDIVKGSGIKYLMDIQIMSPERDSNVDISTGNGRNLVGSRKILNTLQKNLEYAGIDKIDVDRKFNAIFEHRVASTIARECTIPAVQLEINWNLLDTEASDGSNLEKLVEALNRAISELGS